MILVLPVAAKVPDTVEEPGKIAGAFETTDRRASPNSGIVEGVVMPLL